MQLLSRFTGSNIRVLETGYLSPLFQAFQVISDAQAMEKQKMLKLSEFYSGVEKVVSDLDDTLLQLLNTSDGDVLEKIKRRMEEIENKEYVVLVAGVLNLVLYKS